MKKKYLDPSILKKISKDLYYEVSHLIILFLFLKENQSGDVKKHALLESLIIHARNIFYFLYNEYNKSQSDDVLALYYVTRIDEWNKFKHIQLKKKIFVEFTKRINKEIAHLSFKRLLKTEKNKYWDIYFVIDLIEGIDKFLQYVPENLLHEDWKDYKSLRAKIYSNEDNLIFNKYIYSTH